MPRRTSDSHFQWHDLQVLESDLLPLEVALAMYDLTSSGQGSGAIGLLEVSIPISTLAAPHSKARLFVVSCGTVLKMHKNAERQVGYVQSLSSSQLASLSEVADGDCCEPDQLQVIVVAWGL